MSSTFRKQPAKSDLKRPARRGMARFEVVGRAADRDLIRSLAKRLAEDGAEADRIRATISQSMSTKPVRNAGILDALRRSPLVGASLDLARR